MRRKEGRWEVRKEGTTPLPHDAVLPPCVNVVVAVKIVVVVLVPG